MRSVLLFALLLQTSAGSEPVIANFQYFRYQRTITVASGSGQSCAVIDPQLFPHASASLKDLRLYRDGREVPYAITLSESQQATATRHASATQACAAATSFSIWRCRTVRIRRSRSTLRGRIFWRQRPSRAHEILSIRTRRGWASSHSLICPPASLA